MLLFYKSFINFQEHKTYKIGILSMLNKIKKRGTSYNKYHAVRTVIDGMIFASQKEAKRYQQLKRLEAQKVITDLKVQPVYQLQEKFQYAGKTVKAIRYIADFEYKQNGQIIVEDVKGVETEVFKLKRKFFWFRYPHLELRIF